MTLLHELQHKQRRDAYREASPHVCPILDEAFTLGPDMRVVSVHAVCAQIGCICQPVWRQYPDREVHLFACPELPIKVIAGLVVVPVVYSSMWRVCSCAGNLEVTKPIMLAHWTAIVSMRGVSASSISLDIVQRRAQLTVYQIGISTLLPLIVQVNKG